ncbi:protein AMN1 homolog [Salarias fasciatus]|uniref:protein AMN1 homolog n=1 Tax=Salarias fasciatus TaxID=181472 RepID=UPI001176DB9C|nr:uncharacterized protein LOC115392584 [Salarias fasciatus]
MHSYPLMTEQCQRGGGHSQAVSHPTNDTWRNQQSGNVNNSCRYNTVNSGFQQPQGTMCNGGYYGTQMSGWQGRAVSNQAASLQQTTEVVNYNNQVLMTSCQQLSATIQRETNGVPISHGVHAPPNYGNSNQVFMGSVSAYTTNTTSVSFNQMAHCNTLRPATVHHMQTSPNNAQHTSNPTVFPSNFNLTTSHCSINNSNAIYSSNGHNLSSSDAYQKAQQYPAEFSSVRICGGAVSNTSHSAPHVTQRFNSSLQKNTAWSSNHASERLQEPSSSFTANRSGIPAGPPPAYNVSDHSRLQFLKSRSNPIKEPVTKPHSNHHSRRSLHFSKLKTRQTVKTAAEPSSLQKTFHFSKTGAQEVGAGGVSLSDTISRENSVTSFNDSSQAATTLFSSQNNKSQSPENISETCTTAEMPSPVKPSDSSSHSAAMGAKVIAVVQPLPCGGFQAVGEQMSPNTKNKSKSSRVRKLVEWLKKELTDLSSKSSKSTTTTEGGSKDDADSEPQNSAQQSQLDNKKQDAQKSVPSPTLTNTNSPKEQEEQEEEKEKSCPASPNCFILGEDDVYTEQPYTSSWLNVNEQLDDIDKEFGFPWSLKCKYYKHESDEEINDVVTAKGSIAAGSEMPNQVFSETQLSSAQMAEDGEASTLQDHSSQNSENESASEPCYSFRLDLLPPEVAKEIFENAQTESLVMPNVDKCKDTNSTDSSNSKLKDDMVDQVYCIAETMEIPSRSFVSKPKHKELHTFMEKVNAANGKNKTPDHIIDLTASDQPTTIVISDEDDDVCFVENETLTNSENVLKITDIWGGYEPGQVTSVDVNQPCLENEADMSAAVPVQAQVSDSDKLEDPTSAESLGSKECRQSDVDSPYALENVSKPDETFVDDTGAWLSSPTNQTVQLALYGSAQKKKSVSFVDQQHSISVDFANESRKPPAFLSVSLSPSKRKRSEEIYEDKNSAKHCREGFQPSNIQRQKFLSAQNLKNNPRKRMSLRKKRKYQKKNAKKYAVTVKESDDHRTSKTNSENQDPSALQENIVLKFTVLPETFKFKEGPETTEETPGADSAQCGHFAKKPEPVEGKRQRSNEAVNKSKVTWNMNHAERTQLPPFPKTSDVFHEYQKKHRNNNRLFTFYKNGVPI